eukprot:1259605-Lingulodinium_polyedra.AAC.1
MGQGHALGQAHDAPVPDCMDEDLLNGIVDDLVASSTQNWGVGEARTPGPVEPDPAAVEPHD